MKKLFCLTAITTLLITVVMLCSGCGKPSNATTSENISLTFPMTVTDDLGNKIVLPAQPQKIISLALATDEILSVVADKSALYGLSILSDDKYYSNIIDFAATVPHKFAGKDLEKLIQAKPDLVITASWVDARDLARLKAAGIPTYAAKLPDTIDDIRTLIKNIGIITGNSDHATATIAIMDQQLHAVTEATGQIPPDQRLNALMTDNLFYVYGDNALSAQLLKIANINNLAAKIGVTKIDNVSKERIVAADPQAIFISAYSAEDNNNPAAVYLNDKSFANVRAVKNHKIFVINNPHLTAMSQFIALGAADVARAAYPNVQF
ncbi:MAG: ABC transporter substrate-binding protein [Bacillota bacterium]